MTPTPHDALVRAIFGRPRHAAAEFAAVLPGDLRAELDLSTLAPVRETLIDEELRGSALDLLFTVSLRRGGRGYVHLLLEHQSQLDRWVAFRLLRYQVRIWERHRAENPSSRSLPPIVAVLLANGPRPWRAPARFTSLLGIDGELRERFGRLLVDFELVVDDLSRPTEEQILSRRMDAVARLALVALAASRKQGSIVEHVARRVGEFSSELRGPSVVSPLARLARYTFEVGDASPELARAQFAAALAPRIRSRVMTTADMMREQDRLDLLRKILLDVVGVRFGAVDPGTRRRIETATSIQLEAWIRRAVIADSLGSTFEPAGRRRRLSTSSTTNRIRRTATRPRAGR